MLDFKRSIAPLFTRIVYDFLISSNLTSNSTILSTTYFFLAKFNRKVGVVSFEKNSEILNQKVEIVDSFHRFTHGHVIKVLCGKKTRPKPFKKFKYFS